MKATNRAYTRLSMSRRYESWFLRFGLADGSGAWWIRYVLTSPARNNRILPMSAPAQVWATWFPRDGAPETFIQEFPLAALKLPSQSDPCCLEISPNRIDAERYIGSIEARGKHISWDLHCRSNFSVMLSNKGWIGFSCTPHSDGIFSGEIRHSDRVFRGDPIGLGVQGHNCGFRHRHFWTWTHACFPQSDGSLTTLEALVYEMPLGLRFKKAILWHHGRAYLFRNVQGPVRNRANMQWDFHAHSSEAQIEAQIDGAGSSLHRIPYVKTDCSGTFEVSNNSRARAKVRIQLAEGKEEFTTADGAVLEMTGDYKPR